MSVEILANIGFKFEQHTNHGGGVQGKLFFPNGYGVSVIRTPHSYGGVDMKWELAILFGDKESYEISYNSGITDDVVGWLSEQEVLEYIERIKCISEAI
tara:strand:- start:16079 stop:16375 length:297 start_codon:yes stop_codon:yes gene_type:complete